MLRRLCLLAILLASLVSGVAPAVAAPMPAARPEDQIDDLMAAMSPDEIVGQLFLVGIARTDVGPDSDAAKLVLNYHVGGVLLLAANDNVTDEARAPAQVLTMVNALQMQRYTSSLPPPGESQDETQTPQEPVFVPLFVAVGHEGDGYPYTQIRSGTTPLPDEMALGATWNQEDATEVGRITGEELSAMGVNMLLGPSLDVLDTPRPEAPGDLGTRSLGGDPYWVGVLGKAYIRGVHSGARGRVAVVSVHFPGTGSSDRRAEDEVATVRRSLAELQQFELAPFFAVTGGTGDDALAMTDALLTTHIRYQGFQGNIRESTRPISLDPTALQALMALPDFAAWRNNGGVIVSDSLGVRAIKRFYAALGYKEFPHKQVARDAFLAGNDILMLSEFADSSDWAAQLASIEDTITYFVASYKEDQLFRARVDESVRRILRLKLLLYGNFGIDTVLAAPSGLAAVGQGRDQVFQVARDAVTLVSPAPEFLPDRVPNPPTRDDNIVIFTDVREARQCSTCPLRPLIAVDALQSAIVRLYGAGGQVNPARIQSFSFADLKEYLAVQVATPAAETPPPIESPPAGATLAPTPTPPESITRTLAVQNALTNATWVLFAMLDVVPEYPASDAVKVFLAQRSDLLAGRKIIGIAYSAPYYLDTTEISKLTAYYAAYSKVEPFVDASVRAIFQELPPRGAPPVSIAGAGYDLRVQVSPDPAQDIPIAIVDASGAPVSAVPDVTVGDKLRVATGVILDHNGHAVPDGTPVQFHRTYAQEGVDLPDVVGQTQSGVAVAEVPLEREGALQITASSAPAVGKTQITITIRRGAPPIIVTVQPTATPTPVPPEPTRAVTPRPTGTPTPPPGGDGEPGQRRVTGLDLLGALAGIGALGALAYRYKRNGSVSPDVALRWALLTGAGGLLAYNAYALGFPGTEALRNWLNGWTAVAVAWSGAGLGLLAAWAWSWWGEGTLR